MIEIKKGKPLLGHTQLDLWECYAKVVLEELFPVEFAELEMADKPDLQDRVHNVGIEVSRAEHQEFMEAESLYSNLSYSEDKIVRERLVKRINEILEPFGGKYEDGILFYGRSSDNFSLINQAIRKKCEKINKGEYIKFTKYYLFIFGYVFTTDNMLKCELDYLTKGRVVDFYQKVYVLLPSGLCYFDLVKSTSELLHISSIDQYRQARLAIQLVEEGEVNVGM